MFISSWIVCFPPLKNLCLFSFALSPYVFVVCKNRICQLFSHSFFYCSHFILISFSFFILFFFFISFPVFFNCHVLDAKPLMWLIQFCIYNFFPHLIQNRNHLMSPFSFNFNKWSAMIHCKNWYEKKSQAVQFRLIAICCELISHGFWTDLFPLTL